MVHPQDHLGSIGFVFHVSWFGHVSMVTIRLATRRRSSISSNFVATIIIITTIYNNHRR